MRGDKLERLSVQWARGARALGVRDKKGKGEVEAQRWKVKAWRRVISQVSWGSGGSKGRDLLGSAGEALASEVGGVVRPGSSSRRRERTFGPKGSTTTRLRAGTTAPILPHALIAWLMSDCCAGCGAGLHFVSFHTADV